uniref:MFS transporter n=1 Tax=Staphylococcus haemolyticus TaxID=1283 RepID=UPI0015D86317
DLRVFKSKGFVIATIGLIVVTKAMYGVEMMLPTYLHNIHGFSPFESGLTLLAGALMLGFISPISGALYNKIGIKRLAFVGFLILSLASLPFGFLTDTTSPSLILVLYSIRMFGVALIMMPLTTTAIDTLPTRMGTHGTAANNTARQVASSIAVALLTSITQNMINNHMPAKSLKDANPILYAEHAQHASIDGFNTAFLIGVAFAVIGLIIVPFLKMNHSESEEN